MKNGLRSLVGLCSNCKKASFKISLIDKCLMVMMGLLLLQSTYSIFVTEIYSDYTTSIDIVVRTTIAGIFGYFISANFIKAPPVPEQIEKQNLMRGDQNQSWMLCERDLQVLIVFGIALTALLVMLAARNFTVLSATSVATISQMRDIVCSSVGFLLGYPTEESQKKN